MADRIVRAISTDGMVQAAAICSRGLTERARQIHKTLPVATAALGRTLAAASMMGNALKSDGASLTLQFKGGGPLGTVLAVSDNEGNVRGYVTNPHVDLPLRPDGKLDVGTAVGHEGTLTVIKDLHMKEPYVGTIDLLGGEIAEDVAGYFVESEQIPTACALGVLVDRDQSVKAAGGYLIQLMPGAGEDVITKVEGGIMAAGPVSALLDKNDDPEQLLRDVMSDFDLKILETCPVSYRCYCSRERVERALISLGRNELEQMLAENVAACETYFAGKKPKETEDILPYRAAFTALGINPNKFLCSIEALLTRIAKGKGFPHINAAVDLGNAVSIKHRLPMGAHDLGTIDEGLDVRLAREGDTFIPFGSTETETPDAGEAVYASGSEIRTRRWTWRQSERGKITEETKAILFPIDGFSDVNADEVRAAAEELVTLLRRYFGDGIEIETGVVTKDAPRFEFSR